MCFVSNYSPEFEPPVLSLTLVHNWFLSFCLSLSLQILQEVIDIFEGVHDDQALRMAANLGFKEPLQRQVMGAEGFKVTMQKKSQ